MPLFYIYNVRGKDMAEGKFTQRANVYDNEFLPQRGEKRPDRVVGAGESGAAMLNRDPLAAAETALRGGDPRDTFNAETAQRRAHIPMVLQELQRRQENGLLTPEEEDMIDTLGGLLNGISN